MELRFISHKSNSRLILIFMGWGMDATPVASLAKPGYDILAVSDYTGFGCADMARLEKTAEKYGEIVVIAWSFGVRIAAAFLRHAEGMLPVTRTVAVNGTTTHIDDKRGIPVTIFNGTIERLSPASVRKFRRRMFADAASFAAFQESEPTRTFESLAAELSTFAGIAPEPTDPTQWDMAIGGTADAIFPIANQRLAWQGVTFRQIDGLPHYPDFQSIIDREIIDKELVAARFAAASTTYIDNASVQIAVAARLWEIAGPHIAACLVGINPLPRNVIEIGPGRGALTSLYSNTLKDCKIELCDIAPIPPDHIPAGAIFRCCDAETDLRNRPDNSVDIILSASTLQWFNSPASFLRDVVRVLRPGGVAALSYFGPQTYREIAAITGNSLNYPSPVALREAATANGAEIIHSSESLLKGIFPDVAALLRHIKLTGVNALGTGKAADALRLMRSYPLSPSGEVVLTYNPVYLIIRKNNCRSNNS